MYLMIAAVAIFIPFVVWRIKIGSHSNFDEYSQEGYERNRKRFVQDEAKKKALADQLHKKEITELKSNESKLKDIIRRAKSLCKDIEKIPKYDELLSMNVNKQEDLEEIIFLFNNGKFRTNDEITEYRLYMKYEKNRENFNTERHVVNIFAFLIPFVSVFCIVFLSSDYLKDLWFIGIPIALVPALIAGCVGGIIGYSVNISNAKVYSIPDNDERVANERLKRGIGLVGGAIGISSTIKSVKKAAKDISNVDAWKEFK